MMADAGISHPRRRSNRRGSEVTPTGAKTGETAAPVADPRLKKWNKMHPIRWVPPGAGSLLDVGCNVGALLAHCQEIYPSMRLSGVEVNAGSLETARQRLPEADLRHSGAESLPFDDDSFDCLTCTEVIEHVPEADRPRAFAEMRRVLRPDGRLVLTTPHAGAFAFLDPNNLRHRFPGLYRRLVGKGMRDQGYESWTHGVVWHHHFTKRELTDLAGGGWTVEACRRGGMLLAPLADIGRWPFYRKGRYTHPLCRAMDFLYEFDFRFDYGPASYDILLVWRKDAAPPQG
jgi:SAM-dependent methyltransferase